MTKILLDIDGVLNPFLGWDLEKRGFIPLSTGWTTWMLHPEHGQWLQRIAQDAELVWATSWENDAHAITQMFGLPELEVVRFTAPPVEGTWKLPDIQSYLAASSEPVVWLDDEFENDAFTWANARKDTLLIACDPAVGFTREQASQVLDFVAAHRF